eukprot:CAMPEP_0113881536 /NCGR_PEP_ID=MMETSP0780_2-20120614/8433_1 /TAXON_ID=652834 /ORGANISM="Palpitomonas bilix" /LENGTH=165 /DNA_ID=CAMNT_0000868409 /DNA_START=862 /DNA_END=1359 /DNA_ORIENTATION=- /assembly_acc=CAM_ASM_000599
MEAVMSPKGAAVPDAILRQIEQEEEMRRRLESRERHADESLMESILQDFGSSRPATGAKRPAPTFTAPYPPSPNFHADKQLNVGEGGEVLQAHSGRVTQLSTVESAMYESFNSMLDQLEKEVLLDSGAMSGARAKKFDQKEGKENMRTSEALPDADELEKELFSV